MKINDHFKSQKRKIKNVSRIIYKLCDGTDRTHQVAQRSRRGQTESAREEAVRSTRRHCCSTRWQQKWLQHSVTHSQKKFAQQSHFWK